MINFFYDWVEDISQRVHGARHRKWEDEIKESLAHCGDGVFLKGHSNFVHPEKLHLGNNVHIGKNAWFHGGGGIVIGDNTHISRNCVIFSSSHNYRGERLPYDTSYIHKSVNIGRNVWIGMNVMIIPGTSIGDGAIIGLGTVVVKDIPPLAIVGSQSQKIIGWRDKDHYYQLENNMKYGGRGGKSLDE